MSAKRAASSPFAAVMKTTIASSDIILLLFLLNWSTSQRRSVTLEKGSVDINCAIDVSLVHENLSTFGSRGQQRRQSVVPTRFNNRANSVLGENIVHHLSFPR